MAGRVVLRVMTLAPRMRSAAALAGVALVIVLVLWARGERFGLVAVPIAALPWAALPPLATPAPAATPSDPAVAAPTAPPAAVPPAAATSAGAVERCLPAQLVLAVGRVGVGLGNAGAVFILTNRSRTACYLYGFPGMQLLDALGRPLPTRVLRTGAYTFTEVPPRRVDLTPGGEASFSAGWSSATGYPGVPCPASESVEVTPPDDTAQLTVAAGIQACPDGTIHVSPVIAGARGAGGA